MHEPRPRKRDLTYKARKKPVLGQCISRSNGKISASIPYELIDILNDLYAQSEHRTWSTFMRDVISFGVQVIAPKEPTKCQKTHECNTPKLRRR